MIEDPRTPDRPETSEQRRRLAEIADRGRRRRAACRVIRRGRQRENELEAPQPNSVPGDERVCVDRVPIEERAGSRVGPVACSSSGSYALKNRQSRRTNCWSSHVISACSRETSVPDRER